MLHSAKSRKLVIKFFWKHLGQRKPGPRAKFARRYTILQIAMNMSTLKLSEGPKNIHINNISKVTPEMIHAKIHYDGGHHLK